MAPFTEMTDEQVLDRARATLSRAAALPPGSVQRAIQWAAFDTAMEELDRRAIDHVITRLGRRPGSHGRD